MAPQIINSNSRQGRRSYRPMSEINVTPFVDVMLVLLVTLLLGMPVLSLIGAIAVALTLGLRKGGALLAVLVLPLYVPMLIFASGAVDAAMSGLPIGGHLSMLAAILCLTLTLTPWATAVALKMSLS